MAPARQHFDSVTAASLQALPCQPFTSRDGDEVRQHVGRMFCEHTMDLVNPRAALDTRVAQMACGAVTIAEMRYGADVLIDPGKLENFYLVQIPLSGRAWVAIDGQQLAYSPGKASVQHPDSPMQMYWSGDCSKLVLRYERAMFERFIELYAESSPRSALRFAPMLDMTSPAGRTLLHHVNVATGLLQAPQLELSRLLKVHVETCLMSALLLLHPHDRSDDLRTTDSGGSSLAVRRVRDYIESHAHEPIDMATLSEVAGIPLRTLHYQFKRSLGMAPMQLLRMIRLDRVRAEIMRGSAGGNVTQIAMNWGFDHLGRFAASYRERFGESPRDTLLRHRSG